MHPFLTVPAALLAALGLTAADSPKVLPPVSGEVIVTLPDLRVTLTTRGVRLQWTAGGQTVETRHALKAGRSRVPQTFPVRVQVGAWRLNLTGTAVRAQGEDPGRVTLSVPALIAGALAHLDVTAWQDVQPVTGEDPPVTGTPAPVTLPGGEAVPGWRVEVFPHGQVARVDAPAVTVHAQVFRAYGLLAVRLRAEGTADIPGCLLSFDQGRSWVMRAAAGTGQGLAGDALPDGEVRRLNALHATRRAPDVRVHLDAAAHEWVLTDANGREDRVPRLHGEGTGVDVLATLVTGDGRAAGQRVLPLSFTGGPGSALGFGKSVLEALVDSAGEVLHVQTVTFAPVTARQVGWVDLMDGLRGEQRRAAGRGDWLHESVALAYAILSLLRRADAEVIAHVLGSTVPSPDVLTVTWDAATRQFTIGAFERTVVHVGAHGLAFPGDAGTMDLSGGTLARACRACASPDAHAMFRLLTDRAVLSITGTQALTVPVISEAAQDGDAVTFVPAPQAAALGSPA